MVQERTILKVADNSGAKVVRCFRVLGGSRKRYAHVGDVIVASVQTAEPRNKLGIKKKDIIRAVVVRSRAPMRRLDGSYVRFDENAVILIDAKRQPRATRVFGPIPKELKEKGYDKIVSLAPVVV
ncbi:MAG: 50S ribosomal protein L14 [bacterium]|nr:50S ribosomal protein L14 [bacterium]